LSAVAVLESRRAFHRCATFAQSFHDAARKCGEASGPATIAHPSCQLAAISFDAAPFAFVNFRSPQLAVLFNHQRAGRTKDFQTMFWLAGFDHRKRGVAGGAFSQFAVSKS